MKNPDDMFVHTPEDYVPTDDETNNEAKGVDEEEYERIQRELYDDVNVRLTYAEQDDEGKEDVEITNATQSIIKDENAMDKGVVDQLKKRKLDDAEKNEGPFVGSDRGLKRQKTSKDTEPSKKAKSTETSKGTSKSQLYSTGKSVQAEETVFEARDTQGPQNLREDTGNTDEPPVVNVDLKDWFKKPERPPTPDPKWNEGKSVENKPTQK
ncbi:hypothetical protein Tco_0878859 [Tanacetum coccineum]|uniref:Uncharacterized protein n=1 Tax=Tanacetum coccineum TaxID=301880 RepID=A0ABQ5C0N1_9ASTR